MRRFHAAQVYSNILFWIINTPTFQMVSLLVSSPLSLSVALWGMSGQRLLQTSLDTLAHIHLYSPNRISYCCRDAVSTFSHTTTLFRLSLTLTVTTHRSSRHRSHRVVIHRAGQRKQEQPRKGAAYERERHPNARNGWLRQRVFRLKPPFIISAVECFQIAMVFPQLFAQQAARC